MRAFSEVFFFLGLFLLLLQDLQAQSIEDKIRNDPDLSETDIIRRHIGVVETHTVTTADGYFLNLFRIPRENPKDVILFQHPFAVDSKIWVAQYKESTAFLFWRAGYDVWLSNNRGTLYANKHVNLTTADEKFWDFSFHEMGVYDIHATISHIKKVTGRSKIVFFGHSMGTMAGLVYASMRPKEAAESLKVMINMSATAFLKYAKSPLLYLANLNGFLRRFNKLIHWYSLLDYKVWYMRLFRKILIALPAKKWFVYVLCIISGWSPENYDPQFYNLMISQFGSEFSWKIAYHDFQIINAGGMFQMYDYGKKKNLKLYKQEKPPLYPLENITIPVYLVYGSKDIIAQPEFLAQLEKSQLANVTLQYKQATIFAPINEAFQKYGKVDDPNALVLYHMTTIPKRTDQLGTSYSSLNSELEGNPPLWITHITGTYHDDIFVNNARVLVSQSNIQTVDKNQMERVLHKIDEVLVPTRSSKSAQHKVYNPTALEFLEYYESLIIHPHRLRSFRQKVQHNNKQDIFKTEGGHTFFIPVDEGFKNKRAELIDGKIIDGHVIPKQVLFTSPTKKDVPFQTLANGDNNVRVVISFTQETRGPNTVINYVKSHTLLSDGHHSEGVVLSQIVQANIPVKNGVVHLIQKPLMVVDNNVKELLEEQMDYICNVGIKKTEDDGLLPNYIEKDGGILNSFVKAINDAEYKEFFNFIERSQEITLFAPCNSAWNDDFTLNSIIRDKNRFKEILKMHLVVDEKLYVDRIVKDPHRKARTLDQRKNLYFDVVTTGANRTVTVEGGGVNATVIQPDLAATNGIIHIIDRVLGVPYTTVYDKLRLDTTLNYTFTLGNRGGFNNQLNDTTKKFTYFVPRNKAWDDASVDHPSAIKKLFMPEYHYHATNILERHLIISDEPYTLERIKQLSMIPNVQNSFNKEVELPSIRGKLRLSVEESINDHTFLIHWKGERIPVYRPNVECTNGVIHVIDAPFLQDGDVRVSGTPSLHVVPHLMIFVATWLLL